MSISVPDSLAGMDPELASYEFRRHLSSAHHLPAGLSYLVPQEELPAFHSMAHQVRGRLAAWLTVRRYLTARRKARRDGWEAYLRACETGDRP